MARGVNAQKKTACAPLKGWVILPALAAILLLAAAVCLLHWTNAVSLRGEVDVNEYALTSAEQEGLVLILEDPYEEDGVMHVSGALLRPGQAVGGVNLLAALMAEQADQAILLNTQMVRRQDYAIEYGADDHCGFHAAAQMKRLADGAYRLMLADETDGVKRLIETGMTVTLDQGSLAFDDAEKPESEAQHD